MDRLADAKLFYRQLLTTSQMQEIDSENVTQVR
jgi:hypothetical protein